MLGFVKRLFGKKTAQKKVLEKISIDRPFKKKKVCSGKKGSKKWQKR